MNTEEFLSRLYKGCDSGLITLTLLPERKTLWFHTSEFQKIAKSIEKHGQNTNTFFGVGLRKAILPNHLRGSEDDICTITTLYADIDIKGSAHAQTALPSSIDEAIGFLNQLPLQASIIVDSGNGIHAYWLLDRPYKIQNTEQKEFVSSVLKGWGNYINFKAKERGWKLDNVSDLARILRAPGSVNHKLQNGSFCKVIASNDERYHLSNFENHLEKFKEMRKRILSEKHDGGDPNRVIENCDFIGYCKNNAKHLPEPYWYAMITNLALTKNGSAIIHELSKPYPKYSTLETDNKINRSIKEKKPHTCQYIHENLGFECRKECNVKAPVVYATPNKNQQIIELLQKNSITSDEIFSHKNMKLCAFAKAHMPAEYARLKSKIKGKVNLRDFEKAVCYESKQINLDYPQKSKKTVHLSGLNLDGIKEPSGWDISMEHGIRKINYSKEGNILLTVCPSILVISKRFENIDDESEKVEISFFRNGKWKHIIAPRSSIFNRSAIIKYADAGLPISSDSAVEVIKYLWDFENENINTIPFANSIARIGWVGKNFFPYSTNQDIIFETECKESNDMIKSTVEHGSFDIWKKHALSARKNCFARFLLAASFASPLLELLNHRVFFVHIWHDSKSGKTAAIKLGVSVWGSPNKLMGSFNATSVGLERMAGILKHLPLAIDELQVLNERKMSIENIIYSLGNGIGRLRGAKDGGMQNTTSWRNIVITSGEQPMSKESSNDGVLTRVLELYAKPTDNTQFAHELHLISESNFGFAGKIFIKFLINQVMSKKEKLKSDFDSLVHEIKLSYQTLKSEFPPSHLDNVAVVCLGDYYSNISVFQTDPTIAWDESVKLGMQILENNKLLEKEDTINRAWEFILEWISSNRGRFSRDSIPCYGEIDDEKVYIISHNLKKALEDNFFDYSKVTRGLKDRGYFITKDDSTGCTRMQIQKRINGINQRCFCIRLDNNHVQQTVPLTGKKMQM